MSFGVYIHFPFCLKHCPYCDFAVQVRQSIPHEEYASAIQTELERQAPLFLGRRLTSVYFGGGTPGLWRPECVGAVLASIVERWLRTEEPIEVTLEADPHAIAQEVGSASSLAAYRDAGVTRLSLGVQSLESRNLITLGRLHSPASAERSLERARQAGFTSLSTDLMFAIPSQTLDDLMRDLDRLIGHAPDHVSLYNLTIEERTPFGEQVRAGTLHPPSDDRQADMAVALHERLLGAGFEHYEVSSYARPGHRSRHNMIYWSGGEWLGLGCSAHSFRLLGTSAVDGGERFGTVRSVERYLAAMKAHAPVEEALEFREHLSGETLAREAIWLGLRRLIDGVERRRYEERFGFDPVEQFAVEFRRLSREGLVEISETCVRLTSRGALFADEAGGRFV